MATFEFHTLSELTTFVIQRGRLLYPARFTVSYDMMIMRYQDDKPENTEVVNTINEQGFDFLEVNKEYLERLKRRDFRRIFLTDEGEDQFFYYDDKKDKLFLASRKVDVVEQSIRKFKNKK